MPINILGTALIDGTDAIPGWKYIKTYGSLLVLLGSVKYHFGGASNTWERDLHGKVFMITGATSGMGKYIAYELARKGAQIVLLVRSTNDSWTVDYVEDLRQKTENLLIYAEECDLASLHSVRKFATKWLDNSPPRRLDGIICCGADTLTVGTPRQVTVDGVERQMGINYLAHYHLLTLLSPSLRIQPPDRDVRVVVVSCSSQALGEVDEEDLLWANKRYPANQPWKVFGSSKLLLSLFAKEFQKRVNAIPRSDKAPCNVRINIVNPGLMRTPSTRRFLSLGSILGLILYLVLYPIWFIFFKNSVQGSQSVLHALFSPVFASIDGGNYVQECKIVPVSRTELKDEELHKRVYDETEKLVADLEKKSALERNKSKENATPSASKAKKATKSKARKTATAIPTKQALSGLNAPTQASPETDLPPEILKRTEDRFLSIFMEEAKKSYNIPSNTERDELPLFPEMEDLDMGSSSTGSRPKRNTAKSRKA